LNDRAEARFDKQDFIYDAEDDEYRRPAGERDPALHDAGGRLDDPQILDLGVPSVPGTGAMG
jgi:hypothetical protein